MFFNQKFYISKSLILLSKYDNIFLEFYTTVLSNIWNYRKSFLLRAARIAPVSAPLVMEFHGSSFPRRWTKPQSIVEKSPPQTAKLPAKWPNNKLTNDSCTRMRHFNNSLTANLRPSDPHSICTSPQSVSHTLKQKNTVRCRFKKAEEWSL